MATSQAPELQVTDTIDINASTDTVWNVLRDFNGMASWHPAVAKSEIVSGSDNTEGAVRLLTLQDGGTITETLQTFSDDTMSLTYTINQGVLPVSNYVASITVTASGNNAASVQWKGNFMRKSLQPNPPSGEDDDTAIHTITAVYKAGLSNLKKLIEGASR